MSAGQNMEQEIDRITLQKSFGSHLVSLREAKGWTAAELARKAYMETSNIARLEKGRQNPSLLVLIKLCMALELTMPEFFEGFDQP